MTPKVPQEFTRLASVCPKQRDIDQQLKNWPGVDDIWMAHSPVINAEQRLTCQRICRERQLGCCLDSARTPQGRFCVL